MSSGNAGIVPPPLVRAITRLVLDDDLEGRDAPVSVASTSASGIGRLGPAPSWPFPARPSQAAAKTEDISTADEKMLLDVLHAEKPVSITDLVDLARRLKYTSHLPFAPNLALKCTEQGLFVHGDDKKGDSSALMAHLQENLYSQTARPYDDELASSLELARMHIFLISRAHRVLIRRQAEHEKKLSQVGEAFDRSSSQAAPPPLAPLTRVGLKALCSTAVLLISTCQTHNPAVISHVISIADEALSELPALALSPSSFSADMMSCLQPLFDFLRSTRDASNLNPQLSHQILVLLLRLALLRGSVAELLDSVHSFLDMPAELASTEYSLPLHAVLSACESNPLAHKMSNASNNTVMLTGLEASAGILHILDQGASRTLLDLHKPKPVLTAFQPMAIELKMNTIASLYRLVLRVSKQTGLLSATSSATTLTSESLWETLLSCAVNLLDTHLQHLIVAEKIKRPLFQMPPADRTRIFNLLTELTKIKTESKIGSRIASLAADSISQCFDLFYFNSALKLLACDLNRDSAPTAQVSLVRSLCRKFGTINEAFSIVDCVSSNESSEKAEELWSKVDRLCFVWLDKALTELLSVLSSGKGSVTEEIDEVMKVVLSMQQALFSRLDQIHSSPSTAKGADVLIPWAQHWSQGCLHRVGSFCQKLVSVLRAESDNDKIYSTFYLLQKSHFNRLCTPLMSGLTFGFQCHQSHSTSAGSPPMSKFALNIAPDTLVFVREVLDLKSVLDSVQPTRTENKVKSPEQKKPARRRPATRYWPCSACTFHNKPSARACEVCEIERASDVEVIEEYLSDSSDQNSSGRNHYQKSKHAATAHSDRDSDDSDSGITSVNRSVLGSDRCDHEGHSVVTSQDEAHSEAHDVESQHSDAESKSHDSDDEDDDENDENDSNSQHSSEEVSEGEVSGVHESSEECDEESESGQIEEADECDEDGDDDDDVEEEEEDDDDDEECSDQHAHSDEGCDDSQHDSTDESSHSSSHHSSDDASDQSSEDSDDNSSGRSSNQDSVESDSASSNSDSDSYESSNHSDVSFDSEDSQPLQSARVRVHGHRHMLRHVRHRRGNADCDRCGDTINERSWYCGRCSYDLCLPCFEHRRRAHEDRECSPVVRYFHHLKQSAALCLPCIFFKQMMCDGAFLAVLAWYDHQEGFAPDVDLKTQIRNRKSLTREMPAVLAEFLADFDSLDPRGTGLVPLSKLAKLGFVKQHMQLPPGSGSVKMTDLLRIHLRNETKSVELMELFSHFDLVDRELHKVDFSHVSLEDHQSPSVWFAEQFSRHAVLLASSLSYSLCIGDNVRDDSSKFSPWQRTNLLAGGLNMNSTHPDKHEDVLSALKVAIVQNNVKVDLKEESDVADISNFPPFLLSIINNNGLGADLLNQLKQIRDPQMVQSSIREKSEEAVRLLFAVLVLHFDRVSLAEAEAARSDAGVPNSILGELWNKSFVARRKCAEFHGFNGNVDEFMQMFRQRSLMLLRFMPATAEPSFFTNSNDPAVSAPMAASAAAPSNNVLPPRAPSFMRNGSSNRQLSMPRQLSLASRSESSCSSISTYQSGWIKVKRLLKSICTLGRSIDACHKLSTASRIKQKVIQSSNKLLIETILVFLTSKELDVNGLMNSCRLHHQYSSNRLLGLQMISWVLSVSANHKFMASVLITDTTSRTLFDGHYTNGLNAAGAFVRSEIQQAYYALAQTVISHKFECGLRFLSAPLTPSDLIHIHKTGFLDLVLDKALQFSAEVSLQSRFSAITATRLIAFRAIELLDSAFQESHELYSCANFVVSKLIDSYLAISSDSNSVHDSVSLEQSAMGNLMLSYSNAFMDRFQPHSIKKSCDSLQNQFLWMLLRICNFDRGRQMISSNHSLVSNLLQQLLKPLSDSTVVLICRLLRQLLPRIKQSEMQSLAFDSPVALIEHLFTVITKSSRVSTIRAELVYLLRYIASTCTAVELNGKIQPCTSSVDWLAHISDRLQMVLRKTAGCKFASETLQSFYDVVEVLGGHFDHIREGASVSCVDGECKMQGILVLISSADNSGEVSVDESTYKIVKLAKLTAIDNVDVPRTFRSSLIVQAMDVISSFLASQNQFSNSSTLPIIETQRVCWTAILRLWSLRGSQLINFLNRDVKARLLKIMSERSVCLHEQDSVSLRTAESKLFELLKFEPAEIPEEPASEIESIHPFVPPQWLTERGGDSNAKVPLVAFLSKTSSVAVSINKNRISNSQFVTAAVRSTQSVKVGTWLFEIEFVTIPVLNPDSQPLSFGILASDKPDRYEEGSDDLHSFKWPNQMKSGDRLVCCVDAVQSGLTECTFFLNNQPLQPDGCSATCSRSHPNYSMCLRCSQRWGTHSGHGCPGTGQRGSFRNETQIDSKISFQRGRKQLFAFISLAPGVVIDAHFVDSDIQFKQDVGSGKTYFAWHQQPKKMPLQAPPYPFAAWSDLGKVDDQISQMMEAHPKADGSIVLKHKELTPAETQKLDLINSKLRLQKKWLNFLDGFSVHVKWNIKLAEMLSKLLSCGSNTVVLENGGLLKFFRADVEFESHFDSIGDSSAIVWVANQREHRIHISGSKYLSFECNQDSAGPDFEILNSNALHHVSVWRFALTPAQVSSVFAFDVQQLHADLAESPTSSVGQLSSGFLGPSWWNSEDPASAWSQGRTVLENPPSFRPAGSRSFDVVEFEPGTYFCNGNSTETTGKFPVCLTSGVWYYECMLVSRTQSNQGNQGIDISSGSTNVNIGFAHSTFDAEPSSSLGMSGLHAWAFDVDRRDWCFGGDRSDSGCRQSLGDSVGIIANLESPSREFWLVMSGQFFGPLSTNFSLESGITPHVSFKPNSGILVKFSAHNMRYFSLALDKFPTLRPIVFGADDGNSIRDQIKLRSNPNSLLDPSVFHKHRSGAIQTNWKFTNLRDQSSCVLNAEGHLASCSSDSMSSLKADQSVTGGCWVYQAVMKEACRHRIGWCVSPRNSTAKCGEDNSSWGFDCKSKDKYHNQDSNDWGAYGQVGDTISAVCSFEHVFVEFAYFVNDRCIGVAFRSTSVNSPLSPFISIGEGKFQLNCSLTSLRFLSDIRKIYPKVLPIEVPAHLLSPLGLDIASEPSLSLMKFPISWLKQAESAISEITIQETSVNSSSDSNSQTSSTSVVPYVSMLKSKAAKFRVISDWLVAHSSRLATEDKFSGDVSLCRALISSKQYAETDVVNSILSSNGNHAVAVKSLRLQQPLAESVSSADFEMITAMLHKVPTVSAPLPMINHHAIDWFKIDDEETQIEKAPVVAGEFQHDVISDLTHQNYDAVHTAFENRLQVATARRALLKYIQSAVQHDDNIGQFLLHDVLPHSADATHATQPLLNILMRFVLLSKDLEEIENLRVVLSSLVRKFSVSSSAHAPGFFEAISDELFLQLIFLIRDSIKDEQLSHSELAIVDGKTAHTELLLFLLKFVIHECKHSPILVSQLLPTRVLSVLMQLSFPRISSQTALKVSEKFPLHLLQHVVSVLSIPTAISQLPVGLIEDLSRSWFEMSTQLISSENKSYLDTNFQSPDTSFSFSPIAQGAVAVCILIAAKCQAQKPDWLNSLTDFCVLQSYLVSTSAQEASSPGAQISEGKIELLSTTLRDALKNDFTQSSASNAEFCVDDAELVALMNRSMDSRGRIAFGDKSMFKSLTQASEPVLKARSNVLEAFSKLYSRVLPFVDITLPNGSSILSDLFMSTQTRARVLWIRKSIMWSISLVHSQCRGEQSFTVHANMLLAAIMRDAGRIDYAFSKSVFGQVFQEIKSRDAKYLRVGLNARAWNVKLTGFFATDAGGPYREVLDMICSELHTTSVPLFGPTANNRGDAGDHRDKFVPLRLPHNAVQRQLRIEALEFVGQLCGLAARSQNLLPLRFPSIVWKLLVGEQPDLSDIAATDIHTAKLFNDPTAFVLLDAPRFEVIPGGGGSPFLLVDQSKATSLSNYSLRDALLQYRLHEHDEACAAIRRGLCKIVPRAILSVLSWREMERLVCGGAVDLALLKENTEYERCSPSDRRIRLFWRMMEEKFDDAARSKFLSFVWGRSRLPTSSATWGPNKFKIQTLSSRNGLQVDQMLPITHTCYFSIELPDYSTLEIMTERITFAMVNCTAIDADGGGNQGVVDVRIDDSDGVESEFS